MEKAFLEQRSVVLVPYPFSNLENSKFRPVVVISNNVYNKQFRDFIAVPLTSNTSPRDHAIPLTGNEMDTGYLPLYSVVRADRVFSLEQRLINKSFGLVKQITFDRIISELIKILVE